MKITFEKIVKKLETFCPSYLAISEDSSGIQIKTNQKVVEKIMLALDPSFRVIAKAKENKCQLLITHHPLFWPNQEEGEKNPLQVQKKTLLEKAQINHYNLHTNYDQKYLNSLLAQKSLKNSGKITVLNGYVWVEMHKPLSWEAFLLVLEKNLVLKGCQYWKSSTLKLVKTVVFVSGAGGSILETPWKKKPNLIITGEIKWNQWILAKDYKQSVVAVGHHLEELFIEDMKKKIKAWFSQTILFEHWEKAIDYHFFPKDKK